MRYFFSHRLPLALLVVFVGSILAFLVPRLAPGDPAAAMVGQNAPPDVYEAVRTQMGLDLPVWEQYLAWIGNLAKGDLGVSYFSKQDVSALLIERLPSTVELAVAGLVITLLVGFATASLGATTTKPWVRNAIDGISSTLLAVPAFLIGLALIIVFGIVLPVLPVSGSVAIIEDPVKGFQYLILPALTVAIVPTVVFVRLVQRQMLDVKREEFVETAIAKGISARQVNARHIRRNSLGPAIVVAGVIFGELLGGAVIVENIFSRQGLGSLAVTSVANRDYMVTQVLILGAVIVAVTIQLISELLQTAVDPRVRLESPA